MAKDWTAGELNRARGHLHFGNHPYTCAMYEAHLESQNVEAVCNAFEFYVKHKYKLHCKDGYAATTPYSTNGLFSFTAPSGSNTFYNPTLKEKYAKIAEYFTKRCEVLLCVEGLPNLKADRGSHSSGGEHTFYVFRVPEFDAQYIERAEAHFKNPTAIDYDD